MTPPAGGSRVRRPHLKLNLRACTLVCIYSRSRTRVPCRGRHAPDTRSRGLDRDRDGIVICDEVNASQSNVIVIVVMIGGNGALIYRFVRDLVRYPVG